ncbi:MAG: LiaF-related protein, partial [Flavobacteriaceae bacterium]|nr:LiaF-related protein [Flavobacteriaceae bacterium]
SKLLIDGNSNGGLILLVVGAVLLSTNLFHWNFFAILWPVLIITIGISILIKNDKGSTNMQKQSSTKDTLNETVVFWGVDKKVKSKEFKGGEINVAFGGCTIDLREAKIAKGGAKLHVNCAFGGVEIFVPKDCRVVTNGTGIFGGWDPKIEESDITEPVLEITGGVAFGGVEIK